MEETLKTAGSIFMALRREAQVELERLEGLQLHEAVHEQDEVIAEFERMVGDCQGLKVPDDMEPIVRSDALAVVALKTKEERNVARAALVQMIKRFNAAHADAPAVEI